MVGKKSPPMPGPVFTSLPGTIKVIVTGPVEVKSNDPRVKIVKGG